MLADGTKLTDEIAARLEIKRQVQLMVNETLACGFTEQRPTPRHKRSPLLALTDGGGRDLIDGIIAKELALMQHVGAGFNDEEVSTALEVVLAVTEKLKKMAGEKA